MNSTSHSLARLVLANTTTTITPDFIEANVTIDNYPVVVQFQKQGQIGDRVLMQLLSLILVVEVLFCCFCCLK